MKVQNLWVSFIPLNCENRMIKTSRCFLLNLSIVSQNSHKLYFKLTIYEN